MTAAPPTPDPTVALALSAAGYWVVPLAAYRKHPPKFGDRTHGDLIRDGDRSFMAALCMAQQHTATGWALVPQPGDPVPLVIVDLDAYGLPLDQGWAMFGGADELPEQAGVVKSATGGWHFWFRLPDALAAKRLGSTWDFGNGRKGEIRASRDALQLIVLPGSVVVNKRGDRGRYESVGASLSDPTCLAQMPPSLLSRLQAHGQAGGDQPGKGDSLPTEAQHFLSLLRFISEIPPGEQNASIAHVGQVLGRIGPNDKPAPDLLSLAWDSLRDRLPAADHRHPWTFSSFERAIQGGYKAGARSRAKHISAPSNPTLTDVKAECEAIFGGVPWLVEVENGKGEFQQFILGLGGAKDQRDKATATCAIKDRRLLHIMAEISRIAPGVDQDALVRSPLFVIPGWSKVLAHHLFEDRAVERIGTDPESRFWEILNGWARAAAEDGHYLKALTGAWRALGVKQWLVCPAKDEWLLALHQEAVERIYMTIGDMPAVKRLLAQHTRPRPLAGSRGVKQYTIAVQHLQPEIRAHVRVGYERWKARPETESQPETEEQDGNEST